MPSWRRWTDGRTLCTLERKGRIHCKTHAPNLYVCCCCSGGVAISSTSVLYKCCSSLTRQHTENNPKEDLWLHAFGILVLETFFSLLLLSSSADERVPSFSSSLFSFFWFLSIFTLTLTGSRENHQRRRRARPALQSIRQLCCSMPQATTSIRLFFFLFFFFFAFSWITVAKQKEREKKRRKTHDGKRLEGLTCCTKDLGVDHLGSTSSFVVG